MTGMKMLFLSLSLTVLPQLALAQMQPSDATAAQVIEATDTFIEHLLREDHAAEYAMLTDSLKQQVSPEQWQTQREAVFEIAGAAVQIQPHALTYYSDEHLLAAVDYAAQATTADVYICGFMLWQLTDAETAQLSRFEQNIVEAPIMKQMEVAEAAQLMTQWRCPASLIEGMLSIRLNN